MVGIIVASHGEFAAGIKQSASMILGEAELLESVVFMPSEGPEDLYKKIQDAIAKLGTEEVLFLVDLWGGSPFNQSNRFFEEAPEKRAIVAGLNLPMLLAALSEREDLDTAHEVAKVATSWTKATNPNRIIVVSDTVSKDELRKKLIEQAAPPGVRAHVIPLDKLVEVSKDPRFGNTKALLLFENPQDALYVIEKGVDIKELNVGSMAHTVGKVMVNNVLSMDQKDVDTYKKLRDLGVQFDVRKVAADKKADLFKLISEKQNEGLKL